MHVGKYYTNMSTTDFVNISTQNVQISFMLPLNVRRFLSCFHSKSAVSLMPPHKVLRFLSCFHSKFTVFFDDSTQSSSDFFNASTQSSPSFVWWFLSKFADFFSASTQSSRISLMPPLKVRGFLSYSHSKFMDFFTSIPSSQILLPPLNVRGFLKNMNKV